MRKHLLSMTMTAVLCAAALSGCQKAPEAAEDGDIPHAQGTLEQQVSELAETKTEGQTEGSQDKDSSGEFYKGTIGTGDNKIRISARIPAIPENIYHLTLKPNEALDMEALTAFLDSPGGTVEDTSQKAQDARAEAEYNNIQEEEYFVYSVFGDRSLLQLTSGECEAAFSGHTSAGYVDGDLRDTYFANAQTSTEIVYGQPDTGADFTLKEAEKILLDKIRPLGITEIAFMDNIYLCEGNGYCYYDCNFRPSYGGTAVIRDIGSGYTLGEIYPQGGACITPEGVALLTLANFCGKIADKEPVTVLSFDQVVKILEQYLDSGRIQGDERLILDNIALEYYPVPNLSPAPKENEYRQELELIPVWHIYMSLSDYVDTNTQGNGLEDAAFNICINAVTGEIERVS